MARAPAAERRSPSAEAAAEREAAAEAVNFSDLLLKASFGQPGRLAAMVAGWLSLFDLVKPGVLVYDYAPGALLAAHIAGLPVLMTGTGFEIPPQLSPYPVSAPGRRCRKQHCWRRTTRSLLL